MNQVTNQALAPDYRPLLGKPDHGTMEQTTPMGIHYQANGFDRYRAKWIKKRTPNFLREAGAEHLVDIFTEEAKYLRDVGIPTIIDDSYLLIRNKWLACGGKWAETVNKVKPSSILVIIVDKPFYLPEWDLYVNGMTDGKIVKVVAMGSRLLYSDPKNASIIPFGALCKWELGNFLDVRMVGGERQVEDEIGDGSPCSRG